MAGSDLFILGTVHRYYTLSLGISSMSNTLSLGIVYRYYILILSVSVMEWHSDDPRQTAQILFTDPKQKCWRLLLRSLITFTDTILWS